MFSFNENDLAGDLGSLSDKGRIAFAAATATRQLSTYERIAVVLGQDQVQLPREIVGHLWIDIHASETDRDLWSERLDKVMSLLPGESDDWVVGHALVDDALSSLAYAIRCLLTHDAREAAWAARRAYEAADQAAIKSTNLHPGLPIAEVSLNSHEFVQRELVRQLSDLALLRANSINEVQARAFVDELLTEKELALLIPMQP